MISVLLTISLSTFFFSSRRRHTRYIGDWSSDVCSSDLDHRIALHAQDEVGGADELFWKRHVLLDVLVREQRAARGDLADERQRLGGVLTRRTSVVAAEARSEERRVGREGRGRRRLDDAY